MIETKPTEQPERPVRTRPYTWPEVLRAVAHVLSRPAGPRHQPEVGHHGAPGVDARVAVRGYQEDRTLTLVDLLAWVQLMDRVQSVRLSHFAGPDVTGYAVGVIAGGPTVEVTMQLRSDDLPIEVVRALRHITVDELAAMAAEDQSAEDRVLAGVR